MRSFDGTQRISGFSAIASINSISATTLEAKTSLTAPAVTGSTYVAGTSYIQIGAKKIIFSTDASTAATINAEATALAKTLDCAATVMPGSLALGKSELWVFTTANSATMCTIP